MKKKNKKLSKEEKIRFRNIWILGIVFVFLLALIDIWGIPFWGTDNVKLYARQFWTFALIAITLAGIIYWIITRDVSEAIATFVIFFGLATTGLEDFFFFLIKDGLIPSSMNHLFQNGTFMGLISRIFGFTTVTPLSLILSIAIGGFLTYLISMFLIKNL